MKAEELRACITYANGIDPRVQMTSPNAELWGKTVGHKNALEVTTAIQVYYQRPRINDREHPVIDPTSIRRIINSEWEREAAHQRAIAPKATKHPTQTFRQRNPSEWDRLVAKGRDDHIEDLQSRGIPLTVDQATRGVAPF